MRIKKIFIIFFLFLLGCTSSKPIYKFEEKNFSLAIAPFHLPSGSWEMLAGYYPVDKDIDSKVLNTLNSNLESLLVQKKVNFISFKLVSPCLELIKSKKTLSMFEFWVQVGKCVPCDYLLIPYIYKYKERVGGEYGVEEPASVEFDLFLLNIKEKKIVYRYHFDERQLSLSENLLNLKKFITRKGKWIKVEELAREGMELGLEEMGL